MASRGWLLDARWLGHLSIARIFYEREEGELRRFTIPIQSRGGEVAAIAFGDPRRPVDLVFLHANGFNALTYRSLLLPLGSRYHVVAIDQRGHGLTQLDANSHNRRDYGDLVLDLISVVEFLNPDSLVLAGHSMGGTVSLLAAPSLERVIRGVVVIDPPVLLDDDLARTQRLIDGDPSSSPIYAAAMSRRNEFASRAEAVARYRSRDQFKKWPSEVLSDYVEDGLRQMGGKLVLSCEPAWEANNFLAHENPVWDALNATSCPTLVLVPEEGSVCGIGHPSARSATPETLRIMRVPDTSHFLPMEQPGLVLLQLEAMLRDVNNSGRGSS